jgi:hypothetical protein
MDKRVVVMNHIKELAGNLYGEEDINKGEDLFKHLLKNHGVMYSSSHLQAFVEGMIFASGTPYSENVKTAALILAIINRYDVKKANINK